MRTHETLMIYRVDYFTIGRSDRWPLGFYEELRHATDACATALGTPSFLTPERSSDGTVVTPAEQRQRWHAGLDPHPGFPRR